MEMFQCQLSLITLLIAYRQSFRMFIKGECTRNADAGLDWRSDVYERKETGGLTLSFIVITEVLEQRRHLRRPQ